MLVRRFGAVGVEEAAEAILRGCAERQVSQVVEGWRGQGGLEGTGGAGGLDGMGGWVLSGAVPREGSVSGGCTDATLHHVLPS
jgi:hypothetical protein